MSQSISRSSRGTRKLDSPQMDVNASSLMASLFVSTVGMGLFVFGKKQTRIPQLLIGMALMGFPYFVPNPVWMLSLGAGLIATLVVAVRLGY